MNFVLKYNPSPHTPLPRERGGVYLYFRPIFNWGEGISLLIILLFTAHVAHAQTFPVRVTPVLTPPYTPFLTDYTDPGAERLTLQIMLNDLTVTEFRTKLRMTIEGVGITITTNPNYFPPPISLQGGVPQLIYGSDIADYFKMSNLVFQGLNPNEVQKNGGRLPEGIYRISFEVLDYNRNTVVSNKGSATAWMILNDPPFINLPVNNAKIKPLNPQNIVFQWTPRHRGSPNAAFTTDYDVKLVEIWPAGRNPFDAINTSRPIYETSTSATMVVYGPAETPLVLGREYALQVRARDNGGRDVFKNNGYSEVVRFIYGDECPTPSGLNADDINISKARMRWQGSGQNSDYLLRYREKKEGARWFEEKTNQSYYHATGLRAGTTYEYQLAGACDIYESEETQIETFTTLAENPNAFVCADPNSVPPPDGSPPLPALFTNDFIHAGGFDVVVNKATGSNGRFSGEGLAVVPWFNSAKVLVTFENIGVNTSYQLTAGEIKSVWDPNSRSMLVNEKTIAEEGGPSNQFNSDIQTFEPDTAIMVTGVILSAYNDPDGNTVLETNEGRTVLPKGTSYAISDDAGNGYLVDKEGNIKKTTAADALAAGAKANREYSTDPNLKVIFSRADDTKYGFDEPQTVLPQNYQQTEAGDKVAWKALAAGLTDNIVAASQGVGEIGKATFKLEPNSQALNPTTAGTGQVTLTLTGGGDGVVNELLAYYPNPDTSKTDLVASKLNVVSYNLVNKNLVLITVNTTTTSLETDGLQTDLNNIYNQGVVQWTVNSTQSINVNEIDESALDDGGSGLLSNYTEDMKKILRAYTADHEMADNTYYLFLVKNSTSQSKLGYMPRKKQAGFIFVDAHNNADMVKTIAHELGHGAFHLKHTFSEYPSLSQGVTENLMDYPAKTRLDKWQWDHIHNPEKVLGLFEDDDEGALVEENVIPFTLELFEGIERRDEGSFLYISGTSPPVMPDVRIRVTGNVPTYEIKLVIEDIVYKRQNSNSDWILRRSDQTNFPMNSEWHEVENNSTWDVDFGTNFRGGTVQAIARSGDVERVLTFYIRGQNPDRGLIQAYQGTIPNGNAWYFPRMLRQESTFRQFNNGAAGPNNGAPVDEGERTIDNGGRPNWGSPYGWGLKQLDNLGETYGYLTVFNNRYGPSPDELWNWQANQRKGVEFFNGEKLNRAQGAWEDALDQIAIWELQNEAFRQDNYPMEIVESLNVNEIGILIEDEMLIGTITYSSHHRNLPAGNVSLLIADALKRYNGGSYYSLFISIQNDVRDPIANTQMPIWRLDKTQLRGDQQGDYVQEISTATGW